MSEAIGESNLREGYKEVQIGPKSFEIPEEWDIKTIPNLCNLDTESFDASEHSESTFEYIDIESVSKGTIDQSKTISVNEAPSRAKQIIHSGDTLVGKVRPYLQAFAPVPEEHDGKVCSTGFAVLSAREGVSSSYITQAVLSKYFLDQMTNRMTGTSYPAVNKSDFENVRLFVPPLPEQRRIADILSAVDEQVQRTDKIIEKRKELRQGMLQELFNRGAVEHEHILEPEELADQAGGVNTGMDRMTVGQIPEEWKTERLGELTENSAYGVNASAEAFDPEKPRYLRITDIADDGHLKQDDRKSISEDVSEGYELKPGDLVFARTGATVGKTFLYQDGHPEATFAGYLIRFQLDQTRILPKFAFYFTQTGNYDRWVSRITRQGAQENINTGEYCSILLPLPPIAEQQKIVTILENIDQGIEQERKTKESLQELKRGLMQDLLTGEVCVNTN